MTEPLLRTAGPDPKPPAQKRGRKKTKKYNRF